MLSRASWAATALASVILTLSTTSTTAATSTTGAAARYATTQGSAPHAQLSPFESCVPTDPTVGCARLTVPLDYDHPHRHSIRVTVARRRAAKPNQRIGVLFVNPGGPGGSAIALVRQLSLPAAITDRFDIVGVEPRGLPVATPVRCNGAALQGTTLSAATAAAYARSCARLSGPLLPFINSQAAARDVESARVALHEPKASFLVYSYGSLLALAYLRHFPERTRAIVMDAPVDPTQPSLGAHITALENALAAFLHDCAMAGPQGRSPAVPPCGLSKHGSPADRLRAAQARFANGPIAAAGVGRPSIDRATFETVMVTLLANGNFKSLAQLIDDTAGGSTRWLTSAVAYLGVDASSFRPYGDANNGVYEAYLCRDGMAPTNDRSPKSETFANYALRRLGADRCRQWPAAPLPTEAIVATTIPTLVISTTFDVRSPLAWAESVASGLHAPLLSFVGAGHGIVGEGNPCVDDQVAELLVHLKGPVQARSSC